MTMISSSEEFVRLRRGDGPSQIATLDIYSTKSTVSLSALAPSVEDVIHEQFKRLDPHATFTTRDSKVGASWGAVQMTVRYHGLSTYGVGEITHRIYFFVHGGVFYEFDYMVVAPYTAKYLTVFTASAASIRSR